MIRSLSKILSSIAVIGLIFINCVPFALVQSNFTSPLDTIQKNLENETIRCSKNSDCGSGNKCKNSKCVNSNGELIRVSTGIEIVDYSAEKWGKLSTDIIDRLESWPEYENNGLVGIGNSYSDGDGFDLKGLKNDLQNEGFSEDEVNLIVEEIQVNLHSGERQIRDTIRAVAKVMRNLIGGLAIIWIIISGIRMIFAQGEESVITDQKRSITYAVVGLVAILLIERMIDILYAPSAILITSLDAPAQLLSTNVEAAFSAEIYGLINFIKAVIASIAILFIIINGLKSITAAGEEEQIKKQKKSVMWIIIGLVLLAVDRVIVDNIFRIPTQQTDPELVDQIQASNVTSIINMVGTIIQFSLGFVGLIALGALIYGAGMMVANYGNDEMVQKAKKIVTSSIVGIIIIISAYTIVATLIVFK